MIDLLCGLLAAARPSLKAQRELALENLALRQQLAILKHATKRPKLTNADRAFWVALSRLWPDWQSALVLVKPETVIGWHRKGFKLYWSWKSRNRGGRPPIDAEIRSLIRRMARENLTWGATRIHGELLKLGFALGEATVSRTMLRRRKPPSQNWRSFLRNHTQDLVSIDFFVVPTATFRVLYVFLALEHESRRIDYVVVQPSSTNVSDRPDKKHAQACVYGLEGLRPVAIDHACFEHKRRSVGEPHSCTHSRATDASSWSSPVDREQVRRSARQTEDRWERSLPVAGHRSICGFRAVGNPRERLSSVRLVILASMPPNISRRVRF